MKKILYMTEPKVIESKSDKKQTKKKCKADKLIMSKRYNPHKEKRKWILPDFAEFQTFLNESNSEFIKYVRETEMNTSVKVNIQEHQKYVAHFLNETTPYRGLLLFHGLGSGKTMAGINIAEGYSGRQTIILTPASLRDNFKMELERFSSFHSSHHQNKHWCKVKKSYVHDKVINKIMSEEQYEYSKLKNGGIWVASSSGEPNWNTLKQSYHKQIKYCYEKLFEYSFKFSNYNGNNQLQKILKNILPSANYKNLILLIKETDTTIHDKKDSIAKNERFTVNELRKLINMLKDTYSEIKNPFDHKMIIIDEVHNFITRILNGSKQCFALYELMMCAQDMRIVCQELLPLMIHLNCLYYLI